MLMLAQQGAGVYGRIRLGEDRRYQSQKNNQVVNNPCWMLKSFIDGINVMGA